MIKNLDFSFLRAQPKAFYSVINENLKEMFLKELESEILKKYIKESIDNALMIEADILNNKMKIENETAYNLKRLKNTFLK